MTAVPPVAAAAMAALAAPAAGPAALLVAGTPFVNVASRSVRIVMFLYGLIVTVNDRAARRLGFRVAQLVGGNNM